MLKEAAEIFLGKHIRGVSTIDFDIKSEKFLDENASMFTTEITRLDLYTEGIHEIEHKEADQYISVMIES